jgi:hypothetical protein
VKKFSFFFVLALSLVSSLITNAQTRDRNVSNAQIRNENNTNVQVRDESAIQSAFFNASYDSKQVWDAQRSPSYPVAGRDWVLSGLKSALDASASRNIDWGLYKDRYLKFDLEPDFSNKVTSLKDERTGRKYNVALKLYESDGRFVKTVSRWGNLIGFGEMGFMYVQEGQYGTLFSADRLRPGEQISYRPDVARVTRIAEIQGGLRGGRNRSENMDDRNIASGNRAPQRNLSEGPIMRLTYTLCDEQQDLNEAIRREFKGDVQIADWNDLRAIRNIEEWAMRVRIMPNETFFVTKDDKFRYDNRRQYFVLYAPTGRTPAGFMVHDKIANQLFLGSWYGEIRPVLVKQFIGR